KKYFYNLRSTIIHGGNRVKALKEFLDKCFNIEQDQYDIYDDFQRHKLNEIIKYEIFKKLSTILYKVIERNIEVPTKFKEKGGFLDLFIKNYDEYRNF
ncbi:MAG: hypothetical protein ACFE9R_20890, partial [Candidatus Hermodarchaeota archaeon]